MTIELKMKEVFFFFLIKLYRHHKLSNETDGSFLGLSNSLQLYT